MDKICELVNVGFEYFIDEKQVNNVETNNGAVTYKTGIFDNFPDFILDNIKKLIEDTKLLKQEVAKLNKKRNKK